MFFDTWARPIQWNKYKFLKKVYLISLFVKMKMKFASASHAALTKWTNYYTKSLGSTQQGQAAFALSHTSVVVVLRWLSLHYRESPEEPLRLRDWNPNLVFLKSEEAGEDLTILMLLWQWLTILVLEWNFWYWFFVILSVVHR